jgi:hypothetical protein
MIFVNNNKIQEDRFLSLLHDTRTNCLTELQQTGSQIIKLNGDEFETLVYNNSKKAAIDTEFEGQVVQSGSHAFPDIIAKRFFGLEVKVTKDNKWSSTGNSILETTRVEGVERIYMFFGKIAGGMDIKYRRYQDCLYDIGVTHSPRYKIDMNLPEGKSIFDKMGIPYDNLRAVKNPISAIKDYYRKQLVDGQELWWLDTEVEEKAVSPIIKPFRMLSASDQERFITETMILFPEIFSRSQTKYERPAAYLITEHNAVSSSLRDIFTAGGQAALTINGVGVLVPKIFFHLLRNAKAIRSELDKLSEEKLQYYWRTEQIKASKVEQWKQMIDHHAGNQVENVPASSIFEWGLR